MKHRRDPTNAESERVGHWVDVSRPIGPGTPVWPGDVPFSLDQAVSSGVVLSSISTTCHVGTHLDAPKHLDPGAGGVESIPLDRLIGSAEVVAVFGATGVIEVGHLPVGWGPGAGKVLVRTDSHPIGAPIGEGFCALSAGLVHWLADRGVTTVGVDVPSVDPFSSVDLPAHRSLADRGMTWIEGLWLGGAEPGRCLLVVAPMPLVGAEAAPVRAFLHYEGTRTQNSELKTQN